MTYDFDTVINRMGTYCTQWDFVADRFGVEGLLPFTISDMDFKAADEVVALLEQRTHHGIFGYSRWNHDDYKNAISHWFKQQFNTTINKEGLAYSPSIIYTCAAFIDLYSAEGDSVLVQTPCYDAFINLIEGRGRKLLANPLHYDGTHYSLDMTDLAEKMAHAKILLLCNPHNPTGLVFTEEQLTAIIALAKVHNVAVISDEAHMDLVFKGNRHVPINKVWGDYAKVVLATSTAKGFNLASLGGSYALINDPAIREKFINNLRRDGLSSPPILAITGTIVAYTHGLSWLNAVTDYIYANLDHIEQFFATHLPQMRLNRADSTYFAWINVSALNLGYTQIQEKLVANGLAIMSGTTYGQHAPQFLRMNIACPRSKVDTALKAMQTAFAESKE